jgi:hypothetical protein
MKYKLEIVVLSLILGFSGLYAQNNIEDDCSSFKPLPTERYIISTWVKEDVGQVLTYNNGKIKITFEESAEAPLTFVPKGKIIDGWQQITEEFIVPADATGIIIELLNSGSSDLVYFDDIRIFPYNGNLKSFVYDPVTQRLMAELDENNYATFYEYDKEGGLVRVKKETERGVYTIQETRSGTSNLNLD